MQALVFACKAWGLRLRRALRDAADAQRPRRHGRADALRAAPLRAESASALWRGQEPDVALVAGKLQNLRLALRHLDGVEVPAYAVFSFWKQVGRVTRARGYVAGRELREGCLIPSIGGGLCQLSNAVYDSAERAGLEIVERHRHSRVIPGSLAEQGRDATVFWNYIDLRLRAPFAWRLEAHMDAHSLRVGIRAQGGAQTPRAVPIAQARMSAPPNGDCTSCGQTACHLHTGPSGLRLHASWWIAEAWPEFLARFEQARALDETAALHRLDRRSPPRRALDGVRWRHGRWRGQALPQLRLAQLDGIARRMLRHLRPRDVDLVLPQSLLPFLWRAGALAGRRFAVLMTAQPMAALQAELDRAAAAHPEARSLRDFRVGPEWMEMESQALQAANAWISPHAVILEQAGARALAAPWFLPPAIERPARRPDGPPRLFFAASPLARKGIFELLDAARDLRVEILLPPGDGEPDLDRRPNPASAQFRRVTSYREGLRQADLAVLPAWVEHQPRALLAAIAGDIPVIATPACGLGEDLPWRRVQAGDVPGLRSAIGEFTAAIAIR
jgi:glycosyltransferase involved in cell wall biosynthesis